MIKIFVITIKQIHDCSNRRLQEAILTIKILIIKIRKKPNFSDINVITMADDIDSYPKFNTYFNTFRGIFRQNGVSMQTYLYFFFLSLINQVLHHIDLHVQTQIPFNQAISN